MAVKDSNKKSGNKRAVGAFMVAASVAAITAAVFYGDNVKDFFNDKSKPIDFDSITIPKIEAQKINFNQYRNSYMCLDTEDVGDLHLEILSMSNASLNKELGGNRRVKFKTAGDLISDTKYYEENMMHDIPPRDILRAVGGDKTDLHDNLAKYSIELMFDNSEIKGKKKKSTPQYDKFIASRDSYFSNIKELTSTYGASYKSEDGKMFDFHVPFDDNYKRFIGDLSKKTGKNYHCMDFDLLNLAKYDMNYDTPHKPAASRLTQGFNMAFGSELTRYADPKHPRVGQYNFSTINIKSRAFKSDGRNGHIYPDMSDLDKGKPVKGRDALYDFASNFTSGKPRFETKF